MSALAFAGLDLADYAASLNAQMQGRSAEDVLNIAIGDLFPGQIALVSSFGADSAVLLHLAAQTDKATPINLTQRLRDFGAAGAYLLAPAVWVILPYRIAHPRHRRPAQVPIPSNPARDGSIQV